MLPKVTNRPGCKMVTKGRGATALTDAKIAGLKASQSGQVEISDAKVPGLRIRVGKSGIKTFILRKRVGGRLRNIAVGRYGPRLSLADARRKARSLLSDIEAGKDPSVSNRKRTGEGAQLTLRALWPEYRLAKASLRSVQEIERIFEKYILPEFGDRLADVVTRGEVTRFIDGIAEGAPVMARSVHAQLGAFYSWAMPRLDRLPANPCRDAGRPPKPKSHDRVLSEKELGALWIAAEKEGKPWEHAIKLLILTGQRRSEVFEAERAEFDSAAALWTIPRHRAKNDIEHMVPLSGSALEVLASISANSTEMKLFPADRNSANAASGISKVVERLRKIVLQNVEGEVANWTLHDIRRTVATGMQRLGIRLEVTEAVLNHISGSRGGIAGVYQRHDFLSEKRDALEQWAAEVARIVHAQTQ